MKLLACATALAVVSAGKLAGEPDLSSYSYKDYVKDFKKVSMYGSNEYSLRQLIFEKNLKEIKMQNAKPAKTWYADVNKFTDLSNEEFKKVYHGHKPHPVGTFTKADMSKMNGTDVPDSVDWRTVDGVVTKVKDQGGCGSCWAFSATETMESALAIATSSPAPLLSPQQIVSCAPNPDKCGGSGGCDGSTQPLAFNYTQGAGLTSEDAYPYQSTTGKCDTSKITPVATNEGYEELAKNDYNALVSAVANVGPISISVAAGGFGWQIYGGGVYSTGGDFVMDHAVQLVGYGAEGDKMYWIVRNSWGTGWGESGYIRIQRFGDGNEPCGMDNKPQDGDACAGDTTPVELCGLCGILSSSSYPTGVKMA